MEWEIQDSLAGPLSLFTILLHWSPGFFHMSFTSHEGKLTSEFRPSLSWSIDANDFTYQQPTNRLVNNICPQNTKGWDRTYFFMELEVIVLLPLLHRQSGIVVLREACRWCGAWLTLLFLQFSFLVNALQLWVPHPPLISCACKLLPFPFFLWRYTKYFFASITLLVEVKLKLFLKSQKNIL